MRNRFAWFICASVLVTAACGNGGNPSTGARDLGTEFAQAADALLVKTGNPGAKAEMPSISDPAVQAFEAQAAMAMIALGTDSLPVDGFDSMEALCVKTANIVGAYAAAGTAGTAGAAEQQKTTANIAAYLDQMFTPLLFSAHCSAAHMPFLEGEVGGGSDPAKISAVREVRQGASQQVLGLIQMASDKSLEITRRRRVMERLATDAANFAKALDPAQRRQVIDAAHQLRSSLPADLQPYADKIRADIEGSPCGNICLLT